MKAVKKKILFFFLLLVLCPVFVSATSLTNDIVSYWKLDESSGTLAVDSVNFANLTAVGGSWTTDGKISNARNQTGSTNRLYSSKIVNSGTGSRTISMWVYANSWSGQRILFGEPLSQDGTALYQYVDWNFNTLRMGGTASLTYGFTNTSVWFHLVSVFNGANSKIYINGVEVASGNTGTYNGNTYQVWGGRNTADNGLDGRLDELSYWNRALNSSEVLELYNAQKDGFSSGQYPTFEVYYYLLAKDYFDNSSISNFSVLINGSTYSTTNGSIFLPEGFTDSLWNLTFSSDEAGGYFNRTYLNQNLTTFNTGYLYPYFYLSTPIFSNYVTYNNTNYTRNLSYSLNYTCLSSSNTNLTVNINGLNTTQQNILCDNTSTTITGNYTHNTESFFNISFNLNTTYLPEYNNKQSLNYSFKSDLYNPITLINYSNANGFVNPTSNISLTCYDTITPILTYNLTFNSQNIFYGNLSNSTTQNNGTSLINGDNTLLGSCKDFFSTTTNTTTFNIYYKTLYLIDEINNNAFNVNNISRARVYLDDNSSYYDFKNTTTNKVNFTSSNYYQLRFDLGYSNGDTITRYVDLRLIDEIRVCANLENVVHYEQIITSGSYQPVVLKSVFSNCIIAADYTRFAFQDALILKAYSIGNLYYLYTFKNGAQTFLASIDGSIESYVNIDTLEFKQQAYSFNILKDAISFSKTGNSEISIFYLNLKEDNDAIDFTIKRMDTGAVVFHSTDFVNPNNFTVVFDYSLLSGVNNTTVFQIISVANVGGVEYTSKKYFTTNANSGVLNNTVAFVISFMITIFGLTFTIGRITFGWFGLIIQLISIAILSLAVGGVWWITFLMMINVIISVYIVILLTQQNYTAVVE